MLKRNILWVTVIDSHICAMFCKPEDAKREGAGFLYKDEKEIVNMLTYADESCINVMVTLPEENSNVIMSQLKALEVLFSKIGVE